jgi:hypothetical protein
MLERRPVTVDERSKACTVFAPSEAGIVGSNPTQVLYPTPGSIVYPVVELLYPGLGLQVGSASGPLGVL